VRICCTQACSSLRRVRINWAVGKAAERLGYRVVQGAPKKRLKGESGSREGVEKLVVLEESRFENAGGAGL